MAQITETENKFLNELIKDCIPYRLSEQEALQYIGIRFHKISESSYKQRKAKVLCEESTQVWLNHFTIALSVGNHLHHRPDLTNRGDSKEGHSALT